MLKDAMTLLQDVLDTQSRALLAGDVATLRKTVLLPCRQVLVGSEMIVETEADFERGVTAFTGSLHSLGVNQFIRLVTEAEFLSDDYIQGYYVTHALRNAAAMVPSYDNRIVLQQNQGTWRVIEEESTLSAVSWPIDLLRVADHGNLPAHAPRNDVRRTAATPMSLYQSFLDRLTSATAQNDFAAYCALCDMPYTSHSDHVDTQIRAPEDIRPFFDMTVDIISGDKADAMARLATSAQFLGADLICGYHDTVFRKGGEESLPPIKSRMILRRDGVQWKLKHVTNALSNPTYPYNAPEPTEALLTHREIQERTKSWPTLH